MGITKQQRATWPMRGKVYSPGAPSLPREHSVRFWEAIARGQTTEEAAARALASEYQPKKDSRN